MKKIKVAFPIDISRRWMGGVNYYRNLFLALNIYHSEKIQPVWYYTDKSEKDLLPILRENIKSKKIRISQKHSKTLFLRRIDRFFFHGNYYIKRIKRDGIDVISHATGIKGFKSIEWIQDFQHIHYPQYFSKDELSYRDALFKKIADESDIVLVSSKDSKKDFLSLFPDKENKVRVLNFVAQVSNSVYIGSEAFNQRLKAKGIKKYFFVPNQFWEHKNHIVVLKAVALIKDRIPEIKIVFTGFKRNNQNEDHISYLESYIHENRIGENIEILGFVENDYVQYLLRNSISIINPSYFEGWSSTVEEAKSIGKNIILSDIPIHREQSPSSAFYFKPNSPAELSKLLEKRWRESDGGPDYDLEEKAKKEFSIRMEKFAQDYEKIVLDLYK